ncbi:methyltransferase family protein [Anaerobacterium chartisolvens]|uniref:Methyltransferase family protein n=1 Tax=Anaerobacterium chartisolvens TaxID=1297424 RepID=A0A369BK82_9FIRM|nr:methyltransferase domain-containing protein [Anaerobacterium chartisolvens]RCX21018.1 methyltransferase family protein [Anaerobacterium chartisolvens]
MSQEEHFDDCWKVELQLYNDYKAKNPNSKFYDIYIDKWATLQSLVERIAPIIGLNNTTRCMELGAGEATMLILMALEGCICKAVDSSNYAKIFAEKVSKEVGVKIEYEINDFFNQDFLGNNSSVFDFVCSSGVIEHFSRNEQLKFLSISKKISNKWVLVAIPNSSGEIYKSYIRWTKKMGNFYDVYHEECTVDDLKELMIEAGLKPVLIDGFFVYFAKEEMYGEITDEMRSIHNKLYRPIVDAGGHKYSRYPHMDFTYDDINVLKKAESALSPDERLKIGFMNFILAEVI